MSCGFQALIGTVETLFSERGLGAVPAFQALIGTVETRDGLGQRDGERLVSSPHRYCRNGVTALTRQRAEIVSSPHRYCRNRDIIPVWAPVAEFQALIGTVETPHRRVDICAQVSFKPS